MFKREPVVDDARMQIQAGVHDAKQRWQQAMNFFENASDPDLVELAIFDLEGARRRYEYMLRQARMLIEEENGMNQIYDAPQEEVEEQLDVMEELGVYTGT